MERETCDMSMRLSAFLDGELAESERADVERHLKECELCRAKLGELERVSRQMGEYKWPELTALGMARAHQRVDEAMDRGLLRFVRVACALAACLLVGMTVYLTQTQPHGATVIKQVEVASASPAPAPPPWVQATAGSNSSPEQAWYMADASSGNGQDLP